MDEGCCDDDTGSEEFGKCEGNIRDAETRDFLSGERKQNP